MKNKLTNLIFAFTFLAVAHHLYAGSGNPWDPRHDDSQNVADNQNEQSSHPEELE